MATREDLRQAKRVLCGTLLRAGIQGAVVASTASSRVATAVTQSGRNVHAIGLGKKFVNGKATKENCVRVYVVQKLHPSMIPPIYRIPADVDGIPTDVIESAPAFLLAKKKKATTNCSTQRQSRQRPVRAGISAGHVNITAGTIGAFCRSVRPGDDPTQTYVLSNNHVFADVDQGMVGDDLFQPGPADGGTLADRIAKLARWAPLQLGGAISNRVDAAIGKLLPATTPTPEICRIGSISGTVAATEDMLVRKHGRTTGYTEGKVTDIEYDPIVGMDHGDPSIVALFANQIRIEAVTPFAAFGLGGDSGSLVVSQHSQAAVGLYFAGPPSGNYGIANPIADVLSELEIQLI